LLISFHSSNSSSQSRSFRKSLNAWKSIGDASTIAQICGFCSNQTEISTDIQFEEKYPINPRFRYPPNLDVVIQNKPDSKYKVFAIECKFTEAYGRKHSGFKPAYLDLDIWNGIPELRTLANRMEAKEKVYSHLDAGQLIKHILGLKNAYGKTGFRLMYSGTMPLEKMATFIEKKLTSSHELPKRTVSNSTPLPTRN